MSLLQEREWERYIDCLGNNSYVNRFFSLTPSPPPCPSLPSSSPLLFLLHPQIFSLVVFASIVNEGYVNMGSERLHCVFNKNGDACNYGVFVGLVGLLACSFFFLLDYKFSSISSVKDRKKAIMLEIGFSGEEVQTYLHTNKLTEIRLLITLPGVRQCSLWFISNRQDSKGCVSPKCKKKK